MEGLNPVCNALDSQVYPSHGLQRHPSNCLDRHWDWQDQRRRPHGRGVWRWCSGSACDRYSFWGRHSCSPLNLVEEFRVETPSQSQVHPYYINGYLYVACEMAIVHENCRVGCVYTYVGPALLTRVLRTGCENSTTTTERIRSRAFEIQRTCTLCHYNHSGRRSSWIVGRSCSYCNAKWNQSGCHVHVQEHVRQSSLAQTWGWWCHSSAVPINDLRVSGRVCWPCLHWPIWCCEDKVDGSKCKWDPLQGDGACFGSDLYWGRVVCIVEGVGAPLDANSSRPSYHVDCGWSGYWALWTQVYQALRGHCNCLNIY